MELHELENWTLKIISLIENNQHIEDSRVELKTTWPDAEKAARRIAGHCNASGGASVLWLIGIDEKKHKVIGADEHELANWYQKVEAQFDGLAPRLTDLNVPHTDTSVVALLFDTDRRPFVVKNPTYGKEKGGSVSLEVPWREGTRVRSARREDLIHLLSPLQQVPQFEVLAGSLSFTTSGGVKPHIVWRLQISLYVISEIGRTVIFPYHYASLKLRPHPADDKKQVLSFDNPRFFTPTRVVPGRYSFGDPPISENASRTIEATTDELILFGPGKISIDAFEHKPVTVLKGDYANIISAELELRSVNSDRVILIGFQLMSEIVESPDDEEHRWNLVMMEDQNRTNESMD